MGKWKFCSFDWQSQLFPTAAEGSAAAWKTRERGSAFGAHADGDSRDADGAWVEPVGSAEGRSAQSLMAGTGLHPH